MPIDRKKTFSLYKIICISNNKVYIGITSKPIEKRFAEHLKGSRARSANFLSQAIRKYGEQNFKLACLEKDLSYAAAVAAEKRVIALLRSNGIEFGYNMTEGGEGNPRRNWSDEAKARARATWTEERKARARALWTPERVARQKKKLSEYWSNPDNRNSHKALMKERMGDEAVRQRIREGMIADPERIKAISEGVRSSWADPEKRAKRVSKMRQTHAEKKQAWLAWKASLPTPNPQK